MRALKTSLASFALVIAASSLHASGCNWTNSPTVIAFGNYSVFAPSALSSDTQFTVRCTPNTYGRITLSRGGSGVYVPSRIMKSGGSGVNYNLYLDPAWTQIWGDTSGGSVSFDIYNSTPQNKDFTDDIFGLAPAVQDLAAGTYNDTIIATLAHSNNLGGPFSTDASITVTVTMTVLAECRVDSFTLDFGAYNPFTVSALSKSTLLKVYCTKNSAPTSVVLNNGSFALGTQKRMMVPGPIYLNYNAALGSTGGNSSSAFVPINNGFNVNGTIPAQQNVDVGSYTDTLVATVNY